MSQYNRFKSEFSYEKRLEESSKIKQKHPDRIPIIVTKGKNCRLKEMDKYKFLAPYDLTWSFLGQSFKKFSQITQALFINNTLINTSQSSGKYL